ncbi:hypothetical protein BVRB_012920 isoform B [Beta vulgaris subsp. vulgaris]|uniref:Uncharacterized protein n=1 Tax=Beta vulgaris subsp. vulgaris TaxID=3555 RepID=A0A0J8B254_BETVV|nr:hypothetical protein BVRB_012920 isoform B [Beta vulgaris subsp. vulgaris]
MTDKASTLIGFCFRPSQNSTTIASDMLLPLSVLPKLQICFLGSHLRPPWLLLCGDSAGNSTQPTEAPELKQMEQRQRLWKISSVSELLCGDSAGRKGKQPFSNLHQALRRWCLTFEIPRTKKSIDGALFSSSLSSLQSEEKPLPCIRQAITPGNDSSRRLLPDSSSLRKDEGPAENVAEIAENSSQASVYAAIEELNPNSPKKKRRKFETIREGKSCKHCNCKKSKCLKL